MIISFLGKEKASSRDAETWLRTFSHYNRDIYARFPPTHDDVNSCDVLVSFLYPRRVPACVLGRARLALNFHPAPLPRYRGLWGVSRAILDGATSFGVTCHEMTPEIDAGPIVATMPVEIHDDDTAASLDAMAQSALFALFRDVMTNIASRHELQRVPQQASTKPPTRAELESMKIVAADESPDAADRKARAFWNPPYPGAQALVQGRWFTIAPRVVAAGRDA